MKKRARLFFAFWGAVLLSIILSAEWADAYVYGRVGSGPGYPADGTVTYIAYLKKGGETDNEILTEDNFNCALGKDKGYASQYYWVDWANFTNPVANDNDTLVILFTGIGAQAGNAGSRTNTIDTDVGFQDFGASSWGASSNPGIPTNLQADNVSPGVVDLTWAAPKNGPDYRVYRSSQGSGAGNGASNGRYARIAQGLTTTSYRDSSAPLTTCWYIVVANIGTNFSGHTDEVSIDAALPVVLSSFTARGDKDMVILEWTTESEWNIRGFYLERREEDQREYQRITAEAIPGAGNSAQARTYTWVDRRVENGRAYWYQLISEDLDGQTRIFGPASATPIDALPQAFALSQNYPNPFNPQTWIEYQLPQGVHVTIRIFNVAGQLVATLVDAQLPAGSYRARWDGQDLSGQAAASGVYFCQMKTDDFTTTAKMVLLK